MPSILQTTVPDTMAKGRPGQTAGVNREMTAINTEASTPIPFGVVVVQNSDAAYLTNTQAAKLPTASGDVVMGVAAFDPVSTADLDTTTEGLNPGVSFRVVHGGRVLVKSETAVVKGARPFFRITASGGNTQLGAIRANADSGNAVELKGAYFHESGSAGSLVWMEIDATANRATQA